MMRVHVSIDMEGVAGVVERRQCWRGSDDYATGRVLMMGEANAAVAGAFDGGATAVVVNDAHGDMCNLQPQDLDPRAELQIGQKMPDAMVHGAASDADVAIFIGYHASAGTPCAVLEHSYSSQQVAEIRVNGQIWGELELNAAVLGSAGVPVALVSGDDAVCRGATDFLPGVIAVQVKTALGSRAARSISPERSRQLLREGVAAAVGRPLPEPVIIEGPLTLEIEFLASLMAEGAALMPGTLRSGVRTVVYEAPDILTMSRARTVMLALAGTG